MILGFHTIVSAYGFWLPNDPRGSWSDFIRQWELLRFGKATMVSDNRCRSRDEHDIRSRIRAKRALRYPIVRFTGKQARAIGHGFARAMREGGYSVHACSILPTHVHLIIGPHSRNIRRIAGHLKARATRQLNTEHLHPLAKFASADKPAPSPWARYPWTIYVDTRKHLRSAITYVENNPLKERKPRQHWSFVTPCEYL